MAVRGAILSGRIYAVRYYNNNGNTSHHMTARTITLVLALSATPLIAGDWPDFMGPNCDHILQEAGLKAWQGDKATVVWKAQDGIGYSGISITDGKAYTIGWQDDQETGYCFDAATGKKLETQLRGEVAAGLSHRQSQCRPDSPGR
jgi:hypothetical protein